MMKTLLLSATVLALAAPVLAQQTPTPAPTPPAADTSNDTTDMSFSKIDTDKSGSLSLAEIKMVDVGVTQADFDKADANKDKTLSMNEFDKWSADHMKSKPGKTG